MASQLISDDEVVTLEIESFISDCHVKVDSIPRTGSALQSPTCGPPRTYGSYERETFLFDSFPGEESAILSPSLWLCQWLPSFSDLCNGAGAIANETILRRLRTTRAHGDVAMFARQGDDGWSPWSPPRSGFVPCRRAFPRSPPLRRLRSHSGELPSPSAILPRVPASHNAPVGSSAASWYCVLIRFSRLHCHYRLRQR